MLENVLSGSGLQTCLIGMVVGLVVYWFLKNRKYNMPPGPLSLPLIGNSLRSGLQTCLIGLIVGLVLYWFLKNRKYNMPPGPLSLPLMGNALQLGSDERYHLKFYEWSKKYGPVITVGLGPLKMVIVNNLETALEVLVKKSTDFAGRMATPSVGVFTNGFKDIAFSQYGPNWKVHRKISSKALRHYMQGSALEERVHTALETTFPELDKRTDPFCPRDVIDFLVSNILMGLCFQGKFEFGNKVLKDIIAYDDKFLEDFTTYIPEDLFPPLQYVYTSSAMKNMKVLAHELFNEFIGNRFFEQKKTFNKENIRHFTDTLLLAKEEAEQEGGRDVEFLTDTYLIQTLSDIFFAGLDTSRLTLYFAILHMIAFPDIQKKVQEELDREVGLGRLPNVADRPNLGYTEAVLHESMRLSSVVPSGIFHSTMVDTEISGYKIPKDTVVMVNHWALHHDPEAWDQVDRFIPERYLDENGRLGPKPQNWLPFSAGKRVCLGEFVAKPELHLLFAGLMQQFSWRAESGVSLDLEPQGNFFAASPRPYKVLVTRRTD